MAPRDDGRMRRYLAEVVLLVVTTYDCPETIRELTKELTADRPWGKQLHGSTWVIGAVFYGVHPSKSEKEYKASFYLVVDTNVDIMTSLDELKDELPDGLFDHNAKTIKVKSASIVHKRQRLLAQVCSEEWDGKVQNTLVHAACGFDWYHHDGSL